MVRPYGASFIFSLKLVISKSCCFVEQTFPTVQQTLVDVDEFIRKTIPSAVGAYHWSPVNIKPTKQPFNPIIKGKKTAKYISFRP